MIAPPSCSYFRKCRAMLGKQGTLIKFQDALIISGHRYFDSASSNQWRQTSTLPVQKEKKQPILYLLRQPFRGSQGNLTKLGYPKWVYCFDQNICLIEMNILYFRVNPLSSTQKPFSPKRTKTGLFGGSQGTLPKLGYPNPVNFFTKSCVSSR